MYSRIKRSKNKSELLGKKIIKSNQIIIFPQFTEELRRKRRCNIHFHLKLKKNTQTDSKNTILMS